MRGGEEGATGEVDEVGIHFGGGRRFGDFTLDAVPVVSRFGQLDHVEGVLALGRAGEFDVVGSTFSVFKKHHAVGFRIGFPFKLHHHRDGRGDDKKERGEEGGGASFGNLTVGE